MSAMLHLLDYTHKNLMHQYLFAYNRNTLLFAARVLKPANSACVCRYRCPLSIIEDDEETAHVLGYCSWTTYKSKRQSLVIDDGVLWNATIFKPGIFPYHSTQ